MAKQRESRWEERKREEISLVFLSSSAASSTTLMELKMKKEIPWVRTRGTPRLTVKMAAGEEKDAFRVSMVFIVEVPIVP